eukprot:TRINITY_DN27376_c0_g1_i1.p1 TRINITY_DN27376_c0_g1~~TRINITY_DN27376_c0_g1_i1.p1  ORF type:complete len:1354 (-),score=309.36 TRINITY_DN27376_c0_g1_i1:128-4189(-)
MTRQNQVATTKPEHEEVLQAFKKASIQPRGSCVPLFLIPPKIDENGRPTDPAPPPGPGPPTNGTPRPTPGAPPSARKKVAPGEKLSPLSTSATTEAVAGMEKLQAKQAEAMKKEPIVGRKAANEESFFKMKLPGCPPNLIHGHPLFRGSADSLREELIQNAQRVVLEMSDPKDQFRAERNMMMRGARGLLTELFEMQVLPHQAKAILTQGGTLPDAYDGVLLTFPEDYQCFEVVFNGYGLSNSHEVNMLQGAVGQEVAMAITERNPFTVRMWKPALHGTFLIPTQALREILAKPKHIADARLIRDRVSRAAAAFIAKWVIRHSAKVKIRLFANMSPEFKMLFLKKLQVRLVGAGTVLCRESGDAGHTALCIYNGEAEVTIGGAHVGHLSQNLGACAANAWWGVLGCIGTLRERIATVTARTDCVILEIQPNDLKEFRTEYPLEVSYFDKVALRHIKMLTPHTKHKIDIPILRDCPAEFLQAIGEECTQRLTLPGEAIITEGEDGDEMFILVHGTCSLYREALGADPINRLFSGGAFGELAVLGITRTRTATVKSDNVCDLRVLSRASLLEVLETFPEEIQRLKGITEARSQGHQAAARILKKASIAESESLDDDMPNIGFSDGFVQVLIGHMYEQPFFTGQPIIAQNSVNNTLVCLVSGEVDVEVNQFKVATVQAPAIFGERSLVSPGVPSSASVRSASVSDCLMLPTTEGLSSLLRKKFPEDMRKLKVIVEKKIATSQKLHLEREEILKETKERAEQASKEVAPTGGFFEGTSQAFMLRMSQIFQKQVFLDKQALCTEGAESSQGYIIQSGKCTIEVKGRSIAEVGPGDFIGEVVILGFSTASTASVIADGKVVVYALEKKVAREVLSQFPDEMKRLEDIMNKRKRVLTNVNKVRTVGKLIANMGVVQKKLEEKEQDRAELKKKTLFPGALKAALKFKAAIKKNDPTGENNEEGEAADEEPIEAKPYQRWVDKRRKALLLLTSKKAIEEELRPSSGVRAPEAGTGTAWAKVMPGQDPLMGCQTKLSASRLKKTTNVYGRRVWEEAFTASAKRKAEAKLSMKAAKLKAAQEAAALEIALSEMSERSEGSVSRQESERISSIQSADSQGSKRTYHSSKIRQMKQRLCHLNSVVNPNPDLNLEDEALSPVDLEQENKLWAEAGSGQEDEAEEAELPEEWKLFAPTCKKTANLEDKANELDSDCSPVSARMINSARSSRRGSKASSSRRSEDRAGRGSDSMFSPTSLRTLASPADSCHASVVGSEVGNDFVGELIKMVEEVEARNSPEGSNYEANIFGSRRSSAAEVSDTSGDPEFELDNMVEDRIHRTLSDIAMASEMCSGNFVQALTKTGMHGS